MRYSKVRLKIAALASVCIAAASFGAAAQQPAPKPAPAGEIEPKAIEALRSMGAYLRSLKTFAMRSDTTIDEVLDTGQKIRFSGTVEYRVRAPNPPSCVPVVINGITYQCGSTWYQPQYAGSTVQYVVIAPPR